MDDLFARLGLPRRFALDAAELERAYLARSRAAHPDYHAAGAAADLAASTAVSAGLNEAYNTLRDPFRRADYLVGLLGGPTASQDRGADPGFLARMMDISDSVEAVNRGDDAAPVLAELHALDADFTARVAAGFDRLEALPDGHPDRAGILAGVRQSLNALKTVRSLRATLDD